MYHMKVSEAHPARPPTPAGCPYPRLRALARACVRLRAVVGRLRDGYRTVAGRLQDGCGTFLIITFALKNPAILLDFAAILVGFAG